MGFQRGFVMSGLEYRERYETAEDVENEEIIVRDINRELGTKSHKLPDSDRFDFALVGINSEELYAFVEVKTRSRSKSEFSTYMISTKKIIEAIYLKMVTGKLTILVVNWLDTTGYLVLNDLVDEFGNRKYQVRLGGRNDRNDIYDTEIIAYIPMSLFSSEFPVDRVKQKKKIRRRKRRLA